MFVTIGYTIFALAGIVMFGLEIYWFLIWWDLIGVVVAVFVPPLAALFPFIYWIKVGVFPLFYFIIWAIGILGMIIAVYSSEN